MEIKHRRTILENKSPKFKISVEKYQWILIIKKNSFYFPNLASLLCELTEITLRKYPKKLKDIKELNESIDRVYDLISSVSKELDKLDTLKEMTNTIVSKEGKIRSLKRKIIKLEGRIK